MSTTLEHAIDEAAETVEVPTGDLDAVIRRAGHRSGRRRQISATIMAVCVVVTVAAGVSIAGRRTSSAPSADPPLLSTSSIPAADLPVPSMTAPFDPQRPTRAGLLKVYGVPRPGFPRVDRVEVKKTTWGDLRAVLKRVYNENPPDRVAVAPPDAEIVYVVVQAGVRLSTEDFGAVVQAPYQWGAIVIAANGGGPLSSFAYRDGQAWPTFVGQIEDRGGE